MEPIRLFKVFMSKDAGLAVERTLDSGYTGQGPRVEEFERALAEFENLDTPPLATMAGTHALDLAYHLAGIGPGSKVISTPMTCTATNVPLVQRGADIIWADVDPRSGLIDVDHVEGLLMPHLGHSNVQAVVAVDWAGRTCDYKRLGEITDEYGCPVIQDGAHSFGSFHDRGSGDYRMWSFGAIKHLNTGGDGGALAVPESERKRAELLRWYGLDRSKTASFRCQQDIEEAGYKYGMNDVAASIGLQNLKRMHYTLAKVQETARRYCEAFECFTGSAVECLPYDPGCSYWFFPLLVDSREEFIEFLADRKIEASEVHSRNDTKTAMKLATWSATKTEGVEAFARRQVNIPCGWWLTEADRRRVIQTVEEFACQTRRSS